MAGRDLTVVVPAGEAVNLQAPGEFIFLKAADRVINVLISEGQHTGTRVLMQVGDKYRPGNFQAFAVENPDPLNPARVTFTVGQGDYQTQTIKGELNVVPSIIKADGTVKGDDRFYIDLNVSPSQQFTTLNVDAGEIITRQLLYTENHSLDEPVAGPLAGGVLIGRNQVKGGASGWGIDLAMFNLEGDELEVRRLDYPGNGLKFQDVKDITPIDDEYFFMSTYQDVDLVGTKQVGVILCRWANGNVTLVNNRPLWQTAYGAGTDQSDAWARSAGIHYDQDTKTVWLAYKNYDNYNQIHLEQLSYNDSLQSLTHVTTQVIDPVGLDEVNVMGLGRINGELLATVKPGAVGLISTSVVLKLPEGVQVWDATFQPLNTSGYKAAVFQIGTKAYTVEGQKSNFGVYLGERWPAAETYNFSGRVLERAEACYQSLFKPEPFEYTAANVEAVNIGGHQFRLSGEVIKASLELFFGAPIVTNYLDAIYGIEIENTASLPRVHKQYSGNETFQRAGQADDFSVSVPGTVRLYVDSTFWSLKA